MIKYMPSFLLCLLFMIGEAHTFWGVDNRIQNWILANPQPMAVSWNIKYAESQFMWITIVICALLYGKRVCQNKENRVSMIVLLLWVIFDTFCYFYNYKTFGYFAMYFWMPAAWLVIYSWKSRATDWLWKVLN